MIWGTLRARDSPEQSGGKDESLDQQNTVGKPEECTWSGGLANVHA